MRESALLGLIFFLPNVSQNIFQHQKRIHLRIAVILPQLVEQGLQGAAVGRDVHGLGVREEHRVFLSPKFRPVDCLLLFLAGFGNDLRNFFYIQVKINQFI